MPKFFQAYRNSAYGPPLVTQKYAPLENIDLAGADDDFCDGLLTKRWQVLNNLGLLPQQLNLILPDWPYTSFGEKDKKPPLVVISSNRSQWIKKGIEAGNVQLDKLKIEEFDNASDLRALTALSKQKTSPPMYAPKRIGEAAGPRNVYVLVHGAEYETYVTNLADTGITVVGWEFRRPRRRAIPVCGFGASRFAAIEFCKQLRQMAGDPWDYAWLFDDNVVAFTGFAGYVQVEQAMDKAKKDGKPCICAGFTGGTKTISARENQKWADAEITAGKKPRSERGKQASALPKSKTPGLVQQAALWNIAELTARSLNFGPIFVTSGEDVSIGGYFDFKKIPYLYYEGIKILKEDPENDGSPGGKAIQKGKDQITELMAESEWTDVATAPPPPVMVKPLKKKGDKVPHSDKEQTLGLFVIKTVLPHASADTQAKAKDPKTWNIAACQATEQTICKAIKLGRVRDAALDQTFKINGDADQAVVRISTGWD